MILLEIILKILHLNLVEEYPLVKIVFLIVELIALRCECVFFFFFFLIAKSISISWFPVPKKWLTRELP